MIFLSLSPEVALLIIGVSPSATIEKLQRYSINPVRRGCERSPRTRSQDSLHRQSIAVGHQPKFPRHYAKTCATSTAHTVIITAR
jgi:hypothetical protein